MNKKIEIPSNLLALIMLLLTNKTLLDSSSSVPLITFGMQIKEPLFVRRKENPFPIHITWINGIFISQFGELCFTLSDDDSTYMADIPLYDMPLHLTTKYVQCLWKKYCESCIK